MKDKGLNDFLLSVDSTIAHTMNELGHLRRVVSRMREELNDSETKETRSDPQPSSAQIPTGFDPLLSRQEVMDMTKLGKSTIYKMLLEKRFPEPIRLKHGRSVRWKQSDILAFINSSFVPYR